MEEQAVTTETAEAAPSQEAKAKKLRFSVEPSKRKERIPFGAPRAKLVSPGEPGFSYRYFNDNWTKEPNRILRAKAAGYEEVDGYAHVSAGVNTDGTGIKGVLMRIPTDLWEEDQALKQEVVNKVDEEIHRGSFQEKPGDRRYIPSSGIKIDVKPTP